MKISQLSANRAEGQSGIHRAKMLDLHAIHMTKE